MKTDPVCNYMTHLIASSVVFFTKMFGLKCTQCLQYLVTIMKGKSMFSLKD